MATVVDLSEQELADLKAFTNQNDDAAAVRSAMTAYLRSARRMQLKALTGRVQMEENWAELEAAELRDKHGGSGSGAN